MSDDLIKRLRDFDPHLHELEVVDEAADLIEQLERENARLNAGWSDANFRALDAGLKLAKAVEFIQEVRRNGYPRLAFMAIAVLAEITSEGNAE
jgi:hypothetical protein